MSKNQNATTNFLQAITANRLSDGYVVYLTARGGWSERIEDCRAIPDRGDANDVLRHAERQAGDDLVVGPYLFKIGVADGRPAPLGQREILRTTGPSVGTDLNLA